MLVRVQKWGHGLRVRIPRAIARIHSGAELDIALEHGRVVLSPAKIPSLKRLLAHIKPGDRPELRHWGQPVGKEVW